MSVRAERGRLLLERGRFEQAEKELRLALVEEPIYARAHAWLALSLVGQARYSEAISEAQRAIHLDPLDAYGFYVLSIALHDANRFSEADQAIEECLRLDPENATYLGRKGRLRYARSDWAGALAAANEGLRVNAEHVECTNLRAMSLVKLGRSDLAGEALSAALAKDAENPHTHANRGWQLLQAGDHRQALVHFREALRLQPDLELAREGILAALKGRYWVYRLLLQFKFQMSRLGRKGQMAVVVGGYLGYRVLGSFAAQHPAVGPYVQPLLWAYVLFVLLTWVADPVSNLFLRMNRFGKLVLSRDEVRTANIVGICLVGIVAFVGAFIILGQGWWLLAALACLLVIPPVSRIYDCHEGWPRKTLVGISIGLATMALSIVGMGIALAVTEGALANVIKLAIVAFFYATIGCGIAAQFATNYLLGVRPRLG